MNHPQERSQHIGNLSAYAKLNGQIAIRYAGVGNFSASVFQTNRAAATFAGSGNLSIAASVVSAAGNVWQHSLRSLVVVI